MSNYVVCDIYYNILILRFYYLHLVTHMCAFRYMFNADCVAAYDITLHFVRQLAIRFSGQFRFALFVT